MDGRCSTSSSPPRTPAATVHATPTTSPTSTASRASTASARSSPRAASSCRRATAATRPATARCRRSATARTSCSPSCSATDGIAPYPGSVRLLDQLDGAGKQVAVVSSSRNARDVLEAAGLAPRFDVVVDGVVAAERAPPRQAGARHVPRRRRPARRRRRTGGRRRGRPVRAWPPAGPAASAWSSASTAAPATRRCAPTAPTSSSTTSPSSSPAGGAVTTAPAHLDLPASRIDPWRLVEREYDDDDLGLTETLFAVGNGYLGMRANPEEGRDAHSHGTFVNGFHETWQHPPRRGGVRLRQDRPDDRQRARRQADEAVRRRRAAAAGQRRPRALRAGARLPRGHADPRPGLAHARRQAGARPLAAAGQPRPPPPRRADVRGDRCSTPAAPVVISSQLLNRQDGEDEYHVAAAALGEGADPRQMRTFDHRVLVPRLHREPRRRGHARLPLRQQRDDAGVRLPPPRRDAGAAPGRDGGRRRPGQDRDHRPRRSRADAPHRQARHLPHVDRRAGRGARRPLHRTLDRAVEDGAGRDPRRAARVARRLLGATATSSCAATSPASRRCAGTCSSSPRRAPGPRSTASPPRASPAAATRATTSGTPRSTSCRSSPTPARRRPASCCASAGACCRRPASGPRS